MPWTRPPMRPLRRLIQPQNRCRIHIVGSHKDTLLRAISWAFAHAKLLSERCVLDIGRRAMMAKLTASKKRAEPSKEFGLPKQRKYPMPDASHARNAKARASQMEDQGKLSPSDKKKIDAKADKVLGK